MNPSLDSLRLIRRNAIAILRNVEAAMGIPSSLRPEIGKQPEPGKGNGK